MPLPSISVVIPLYNHEKFITAALYSIINQTLPPKEIIVIDDGSLDGSGALVEAVAEARPKIIFWSHPNRGAHNTINAGIHRASGDLVAILNSDDVYEPTRLERAAKALLARPEADVLMTSLKFINDDGAEISNPWFDRAIGFYHECNDLGLALVNGNFFMTTSNLVARRSLFSEVGYFADLRYAHDLDFFLRLVGHGKIIEYIDEKLLSYRLHGNNTISENHSKVKIEWAAAVAIYLHSRWSISVSPMRWNRSGHYLDILRKHELTELVLMFLAFFESNNVQTLERNTWQQDPSFMSALQAVKQ